MKRVAVYARVSTDKQTCENQLLELRAVAERCGGIPPRKGTVLKVEFSNSSI